MRILYIDSWCYHMAVSLSIKNHHGHVVVNLQGEPVACSALGMMPKVSMSSSSRGNESVESGESAGFPPSMGYFLGKKWIYGDIFKKMGISKTMDIWDIYSTIMEISLKNKKHGDFIHMEWCSLWCSAQIQLVQLESVVFPKIGWKYRKTERKRHTVQDLMLRPSYVYIYIYNIHICHYPNP